MKAYIIVSEGQPWENIVWTPEPNDFRSSDQTGLSWVEGDSDEQLVEAAKKRFANLFNVQSAEITTIEGNKGVELFVASNPSSNEPIPIEIKVSDGTVLRRVKSETSDGIAIH
jgi:hypothetical protein